MWLDAVALLVLGIFVGIGVYRGALLSVLGLATLAAAYGAAIWAGPRFGPVAAGELQIPEVMGLALAGTSAFLTAFVAMSLVSTWVKRRERRRTQPRSGRDRFLGGVFGAVRGSLIVLLISWLAIWVDALRVTGTVEALPELEGSAAAAVTESVVEAGVTAAMEDEGPSSRLMARMAARPGQSLVDLQDLLENPNLDALRSDPMFWTYVENGSVDAALNTGAFLRVTHDEALRTRLGDLGLIGADAVADAGAFRAEASEILRQLGPRLRDLRDDPELRELVEDPEVQTALQSGDTLALVSHPGFRQLVARVASAPAP